MTIAEDYISTMTMDQFIGERVNMWLRRKGVMQMDLAPSHYELDTFATLLIFFSEYQSRFSDPVTALAPVTARASALATYMLGLILSFNCRRINTVPTAERAMLSNGQEEEATNLLPVFKPNRKDGDDDSP